MRLGWLALGLVVVVAGCNKAPSRITAPGWDPDGFADAILEKLDKNGDSSIDKTEVAAAPGLAWGAKAIDKDKNGSLGRDELVARFELYKKMRIGLTTGQVQVVYQGRPVAGAKVTLVPEFFLEGTIEPAVGETLDDGHAYPRVPDVNPPGMRVGYFRVVVESPRVKIPAKYTKAETTSAGIEISPVSDDISGNLQVVLRD
jgi:hypothetical protein